jgi:hypothetical protein
MNENALGTEDAEASEMVYRSISSCGVSGVGGRVRRKVWIRERERGDGARV